MDTSELEDRYRRAFTRKEDRARALIEAEGLGTLFKGLRPCPAAEGYRGQATFGIEHEGGRLGAFGFDPIRGRGDMKETLWIVPAFARGRVLRTAGILREQWEDFPVDGFELRILFGTERIHLRISVKRRIERDWETLARGLREEIPGLAGLAIPAHDITLGEEFLPHVLHGKTIHAHHGAFFQSNFRLTPALVAAVRNLATTTPVDSLLDVYCGVGLHCFSIGTPETTITGIDSGRTAIESAELNAQRSGYAKARFVRQRTEVFLENERPDQPDLLIVNPPRSGCGPSVVSALAQTAAPRVIVVSCSLESHVTDLRSWQSAGYRVRSIEGFDMFPFSPFLETVTLLEQGERKRETGEGSRGEKMSAAGRSPWSPAGGNRQPETTRQPQMNTD